VSEDVKSCDLKTEAYLTRNNKLLSSCEQLETSCGVVMDTINKFRSNSLLCTFSSTTMSQYKAS